MKHVNTVCVCVGVGVCVCVCVEGRGAKAQSVLKSKRWYILWIKHRL
jgi:hypothetical protein